MNCPAGAREAGLGHDLGAPQVVLQGFALRGEVLSQMGKYPKDRRGTPQGRTPFAMTAYPPVPHYGGRVPVRFCNISGAQNLSGFYHFIPAHWGLAEWKFKDVAIQLLRLVLPSR